MGNGPIGVVVADDHPVFLDGMRTVIDEAEGLEVRALVADGESAVRAVAETTPRVVILDLRMPGCDGIEATRRIVEAFPDTRVLVLSAMQEPAHAVEALRAGAIGFLPKEVSITELVEAIHTAARGSVVVGPELMAHVMGQFRDPSEAWAITPRELQLIALVADGKTNEQIARTIHISVGSVKAKLAALFRKIGATDRASAVAACFRRGLIG